MLYIGLMSGTSLDGVDAVLADFSHTMPQVIARAHRPYDAELRAQILALQSPSHHELHRSALLGIQLAHLYAQVTHDVLANASCPATKIHAIGCHGQTVRHAPEYGYTLQLNQPALLAELTQIAVVADFRSRDIAAHGQGAPLVPAFHHAVFSHPSERRVVLNLGGIANLTRLVPNQPVIGFDTGPANILLDAWIERHQNQTYDDKGKWAASGCVLPALLQRLLTEPYFSYAPPKSTGRDLFNLQWVEQYLSGDEAPVDVQATLLQLTAQTTTDAIKSISPQGIDTLWLCGGGAYNTALRRAIHAHLPHVALHTTVDLGYHTQDIEALAFAWLAYAWIQRIPSNLPSVTGAHGTRILGALYPA